MPRIVLVICSCVLLATMATAAPRTLDLPGPDKAALLDEDALRLAEQGGPERFAWPHDLTLTADDGEGWDRLSGGGHRWQLEIRAPGALSLCFGFSRFALPWGGRLTITGVAGLQRAYTAADNRESGQLWTPVVLGDTALLVLELPAGGRDQFELELARVGRGYRGFGEPVDEKAGSCNIDVVCPEGDPWRAEIRSVGVYQIGATWKCTGAMINNTSENGRPLFLTANHCAVNPNNDETVVVYWNYESENCGDLSGGSLADTQAGTTWLASWAPSDMTLLEFTAAPDTSWHVTFAGWDRGTSTSISSAVTIHHPSTDEKSISFEDDPLEVTEYLSNAEVADGTHWRVVDWDAGTTEPGSSGCPLFNPQHRIIGQLHGGYAACGNEDSDWYGRLSVSWLGGETPETQLAAWLDPGATGQGILGLYDPNGPGVPPVDVPEAFAFAGAVPNPAVGAVAVIEFDLPQEAHVKLTVYDVRGRRVDQLLDQTMPAFYYAITWNDPAAPSGVYFARLETLGETQTRAFTLIR